MKKKVIMMNVKQKRGGKREGAGRKIGSGPYGEKTTVIRVPQSKAHQIKQLLQNLSDEANHNHHITKVERIFRPKVNVSGHLTLYSSKTSAGLPDTMEEQQVASLDLNEHLLRNPQNTFFVRVGGESMIDAGIHPGDLLIVDRSLPPSGGHIVVAIVNGESTVKRLIQEEGKLLLTLENSAYPAVEVMEETMSMIWGVVTSVVHPL